MLSRLRRISIIIHRIWPTFVGNGCIYAQLVNDLSSSSQKKGIFICYVANGVHGSLIDFDWGVL